MRERYFITGATGLVGSALVEQLVHQGEDVVVFVRNDRKAKQLFSTHPHITITQGSLEEAIQYEGNIDYIIHVAAPTSSSFFIEHPVETIDAITLGTRSILEFAKREQVKSVVILSSMEVYGTSISEEPITEDQQFYLDPTALRSSYPMAKRLAEAMCAAYASEYGVPVKTARLAQVLGRKLLPEDARIIAQCIRAATSGKDIVLATDGTTKQTYIGIDDTISGIMTILHKGETGQVYNVANEATFCSIRELAEIVARDIANNTITVKLGEKAGVKKKYPPTRSLRISSDKLQALGWQPRVGLLEALEELS